MRKIIDKFPILQFKSLHLLSEFVKHLGLNILWTFMQIMIIEG